MLLQSMLLNGRLGMLMWWCVVLVECITVETLAPFAYTYDK